MKKIIIITLISILALTSSFFGKDSKEYGVFIGREKNKVLRLKNYNVLVVDAQYLSKKNIQCLRKNNNKKVYSYLNVGSVENFRPYYSQFKSITLGKYENWPEERWVDVSKKKWQKFILKKGKALKKKNIDGLFIDNADVYYNYKKKKIYKGLTVILKSLKAEKMDIIINGGDAYVLKAIRNNHLLKYIDGINQETFFSKIDFKRKKFLKQNPQTTAYYKTYCRKAKRAGLSVYLIEYTKNKALIRQISKFCRAKGYRYYISSSVELN